MGSPTCSSRADHHEASASPMDKHAALVALEHTANDASTPASERAEARLTKALKRWASSPRDALNLEGDAPLAAAALQRAYLGLARRCHPDKGGSHRVFLAVKAARDALADDAEGPTDPVRPGSEDARYFADDPLFGAVHDDAGYESRFWSDDVASGAGTRDRAAMWTLRRGL